MNLAETLDLVTAAIDHARTLGIDVEAAEATVADAAFRLGLTGEIYAVALVGGTGVGKSSLLNALADENVVATSVIRPTTATPTAWIHSDQVRNAQDLLDWVGVTETITHDHDDLLNVVIIDYPDIDSVAVDHRARVDNALPKLDSVTWVVDPEKYDDDRLHSYLEQHARGRSKLRVVMNKSDLVDAGERDELSTDLERRFGRYGDSPSKLELHVVSAATGDGIGNLVAAIRRDDDAKAMVASSIRQRATGQVAELIAGLDPKGGPLDANLESHAAAAAEAAIDILDPEGLSRQVKTAHRERARDLAGSLLGRAVGLVGLLTGRRARHANPGRFVKAWRERGDLSRATMPIREAYLEAGRSLGPESRAAVMSRFNPDWARTTLARALDATAAAAASTVPTRIPALWRILATLQWIATATFVLSLVWIALLTFGPGDLPVGEVEVPILGPLPAPIAALAASLLASVLVAWVAGMHSSLIGAGAGRRLRKLAMTTLQERIQVELFEPLRILEAARIGLIDNATNLGIDIGTR